MKPARAESKELTMAELGKREFEIVERGVCYRLSIPGSLISLEIDRLSWHKTELAGELLVRCGMLGTEAIDGVLSVATFNVSSARARTERATLLGRQSRAVEIPWQQLVEELCQRTLSAERSGEGAIRLRDIPKPDTTDRLMKVSGFLLPRHHPSCLFGDGGSAKSYLALYIGGLLAQEGYRVGLFDWELDGSDHRERFEALFGDDMPDGMLYVRCTRPLIHERDALKRVKRNEGLDFAIYDSVGFACHDKPESSESALLYFQAVREIGVGSLHIAHVNKSEEGDKKPYGSAFWHNSCRATWFIKPAEDAALNTIELGIFQRKSNLGRRQAPFGLEATFGARTTFTAREITESPEFAAKVPLEQRVKAALKWGSKTMDALRAEFPEEKPETVKRIVNRAVDGGRLVKFPRMGGEDEIGIASR